MVNYSSSRQFLYSSFSLFINNDVSDLLVYVNVPCQEGAVLLLESDHNRVVAVYVDSPGNKAVAVIAWTVGGSQLVVALNLSSKIFFYH